MGKNRLKQLLIEFIIAIAVLFVLEHIVDHFSGEGKVSWGIGLSFCILTWTIAHIWNSVDNIKSLFSQSVENINILLEGKIIPDIAPHRSPRLSNNIKNTVKTAEKSIQAIDYARINEWLSGDFCVYLAYQTQRRNEKLDSGDKIQVQRIFVVRSEEKLYEDGSATYNVTQAQLIHGFDLKWCTYETIIKVSQQEGFKTIKNELIKLPDLLIVDDKCFLAYLSNSEPRQWREKYIDATNPSKIEIFKQFFSALWDKSEPLEEREII